MGGVGTGVGEGAVAEVEEVVLEEVVEVVEEEVAVGLEARAQLRRQLVVEEEVEGFVGALAAGALMAVATELGQSLTTYRSGDAWDFAADAAGLGVALVCVLIIIFTNKRLS